MSPFVGLTVMESISTVGAPKSNVRLPLVMELLTLPASSVARISMLWSVPSLTGISAVQPASVVTLETSATGFHAPHESLTYCRYSSVFVPQPFTSLHLPRQLYVYDEPFFFM